MVETTLTELLEIIHGRDGRDGRDGEPGTPGTNGVDGEHGPRGYPGTPGRHGDPGPKGERGVAGPQGSQGQKGDNGDIGPLGPVGLIGPPGLKGMMGPQGPQGNAGPQGSPGPSAGSSYVRWGRTSCPEGRELVYRGRAATKHYSDVGGGINYQCLPAVPEYGNFREGIQGHSLLYQVEYEIPMEQLGVSDDENVPCAVCYVPTRSTTIMIPALLSCPTGWTSEYSGYLMSAYHNSNSGATFECVDGQPEAIPGSGSNVHSGAFMHIEFHCEADESTICPPYDGEKELTCVVCSK